MPPSSDQDSSNLLTSNSQSTKVSQRNPAAGVQNPTKNGKKNGTAKDNPGGGVLAAVTKNASKMSNSKASTQPNKLQSPEMKPAENLINGNPVTSPLLDALSSAALDRSTAQNTNDWAKNVPAFSSSPNNLINLGESPPVPSYDDRLANFGWTTREQRGIPNAYLSSVSPPSNRRRPLSYQLDGTFPQSVDDHRSQVSSYAARRSSMYSQHPRYAQHPPLPHQAQAHFYNAPDANLILSPPTPGLIPGDHGYYCGLDSLTMPTSDAPKTANNVVISGYEGGLNIHAVTKRGLNKLTNLEGLRGGVFNAKILPWASHGGNTNQYPLVAMVIHGPLWTSSEVSSGATSTPPSEAVSVTQNESIQGSPLNHETELVEYYQTTVEVYSLNTKQHVATLLSLPKTHLGIPTSSPHFTPPLPVGSLTIQADNGNVVVASGSTGETWIYRHGSSPNGPFNNFKCIAKVWTTVQHGVSTETPLSSTLQDSDWNLPDTSAPKKLYKASILSMKGRWLAYCPAAPSSQVSLRAAVPGTASTTRIPGLNAHAPPQLPSINCSVDMPGSESVMKQLVQISTQNFIKAGNYLTQQGIQAWNNYRSKPPAHQTLHNGMQYQTHAQSTQQFPPTHGLPTAAPLVTKDPGLISILDLDTLAQHSSSGSPPHPMATFRVPHGCSFLSFAPNGLALFTASNKGDMQFVWDLMRIQYAKSSFLKAGLGFQGPHVRQIAHFSRMTIARIVDVVWSSPHGERAAMVTEPGTVHVLDLPASAFTWPPPRRRASPAKADVSSGEGASTSLTATGVATSAVNSLWTAARPLVGRRRRSSVGVSARTVTAQAGHGTQAIAAGISRSVGAATGRMNELRKSGNTKLHLPRTPTVPSRSCVLLISAKRHDSIAAIGGGIVRFYTIKNRRADRPADKQKASRGAKYTEFRLPSLPDLKFPPGMARDLNQMADLELTECDIEESRWKARQSSPPAPQIHGTESSIPQAEIESNAPYQPFHTDRRVGLHVFAFNEDITPAPSMSALLSPPAMEIKTKQGGPAKTPWAFGRLINATKLEVGPLHNSEEEDDFSPDRALPSSAIERVIKVADSTEDIEQIVITTRRRKGTARGSLETSSNGNEEGFFEDDCEVLDFASQRV